MSLAEISGTSPFVQNVRILGQVAADSFVSQDAQNGGRVVVNDQVSGESSLTYSITGGFEELALFSGWATWQAALSYPTGSVVRSGGVTYGRTGAASAPGAAPPGAGWTALAAPSPLSGTTATAISAFAAPAGGYEVYLASTPLGNAVSVSVTAAGNASLQVDALEVRAAAPVPTIGTGTLVAGVATIASAGVAANSRIFLQRTGAAGGATGTLQVIAKNAGVSFVVQSLDAAGAVVAADVGTFDWWIINPTLA